MLISNGTKEQDRLKIIWRGQRNEMEGFSLDLTQAVKSSEARRYLEFVILGWFKMKIG